MVIRLTIHIYLFDKAYTLIEIMVKGETFIALSESDAWAFSRVLIFFTDFDGFVSDFEYLYIANRNPSKNFSIRCIGNPSSTPRLRY